jgi:hypothetical protein
MVMKKITQKEIATLGYQKAYRLAYRKGKKDAMKDSIPFIKFHLKPKNGFSSEIASAFNFLDENIEVIIFKPSKV